MQPWLTQAQRRRRSVRRNEETKNEEHNLKHERE
jgi:hypothetical protein